MSGHLPPNSPNRLAGARVLICLLGRSTSTEVVGQRMQPLHVAIRADAADEVVQLLMQAKGGWSEWMTPTTSYIRPAGSASRGQLTPLELAQALQNRRLAKLLGDFKRDGAEAAESAGLASALLRCGCVLNSENGNRFWVATATAV